MSRGQELNYLLSGQEGNSLKQGLQDHSNACQLRCLGYECHVQSSNQYTKEARRDAYPKVRESEVWSGFDWCKPKVSFETNSSSC